MPRYFAYVVTTCFTLSALGCGDNDSGTGPTSPQFAPGPTGCNLSGAKSLVSSVFPTNASRQAANGYLQAIQDGGAKSLKATNAGFDLFALIAANRPVPAVDGSAFVNAVLSCQEVGTIASPIDFTGALGSNGAFEVRGGAATDKAAAVSADGAWGLEPPLDLSGTAPVRLTWDQITNLPTPFNPASSPVNKRFLAYGSLITDPDFLAEYTKEVLVSSIFDWSTIPTATFSPGAVVGTCLTDEEDQQYLIQHHADADDGEIIPSATPSFCPASLTRSRAGALGAFAFARRVLDFFRPQPLLAVALGTRPPGGSVGALSPNAAVNPGQILLAFASKDIDDGRTGQVIKAEGNVISVKVTPAGQTNMNGVLVRLIATTNLGATVVATGNEAKTEDGVATFPNLKINKAGGYRLIATLAAFGQNNTSGFDFNTVTSDGFNLKQSK
jgi:hypothetical protein